jgi:hypothetical protein
VTTATRTALLPELLAGDAYVLGRSLFTVVSGATQIAGAACGGLLIALTGPTGALWLTAVTCAQFRTPEGAWHATVHPGGVEWRAGESTADETVTGSSLELLLVLNRRRPPAAPGPLLRRWLAETRF